MPYHFWTHLYPAIYTRVPYNSTWVPWPCGNFGGEHLPQKTLLGIISLFAQDGQNHAVVLLYKWASGQWFQCTFNYLYKFSFCQRWFVCFLCAFHEPIKWYECLVCSVLDISWNSIRCCWMWKLFCIISVYPSGVVFAGTWFERACRPLWAVAPEAGGREQDEPVYELDEVS